MNATDLSRSRDTRHGNAAPGGAQRARIGAQMVAMHWLTALGGVAFAALFTALAARHTKAVAVTTTTAQSQSTQQATSSQPFFQSQGASSGNGFVAPAPATSVGSSHFRTRTS